MLLVLSLSTIVDSGSFLGVEPFRFWGDFVKVVHLNLILSMFINTDMEHLPMQFAKN